MCILALGALGNGHSGPGSACVCTLCVFAAMQLSLCVSWRLQLTVLPVA